MDRVFSVDEIAETFWPVDPPVNVDAKINRSSSEWTFQRFLEEASKSEQVASTHDSSCVSSISILPSTSCSSLPNGHSKVKNGTANDVIEIKGSHFSGIPADSEEYQAILKHQLSLACAAVARSRAPSVTSKETLPLVEKRSPDTVPSAPESLGSEYCVSRTQDKSPGGSTAMSAISVLQKNSGIQTKQTTSESSREQSDEDDLEAETENTENMDPADAKRVRRCN